MNNAPDQNSDPDLPDPERRLPIVIIKTGRTYPGLAGQCGDFEDWTTRGLGIGRSEVSVVDVDAGPHLPHPRAISGAVITGSHSMVTDRLGWMEPLAEWLEWLVADEVPVLGVCFGHQLLAHALGGGVGFHPDGPEIGTVEVNLTEEGESDSLFRGMSKQFLAHSTHAQGVLTLPEGAVRLAWTEHDTNTAFRVGSCAWGVQFHPEYDTLIMRHYVREQRETLEALGKDAARVEAQVCAADAVKILRDFAEISGRS